MIINQLEQLNIMIKKTNNSFLLRLLNGNFDYWLSRGVSLNFKLTDKNIYLK